jgi:two-component system response regulator YesN
MIRIVFADDESGMRDLFVKEINGTGRPYHVCAVAENGREALEMVKTHSPDILITDICMPLMDGLELAGEVRAMDRNIKIIIISGYDDFSYARKAISLGVKDYLLKPFLPRELFVLLDKTAREIEDEMNSSTDKKVRLIARQLSKEEEKLLVRVEMGAAGEAVEILDRILDKCGSLSGQEYENYLFIMLVELVISVSSLTEKTSGNPLSWRDNELLAYLKEQFTGENHQEDPRKMPSERFTNIRNMMREYVRRCCDETSRSMKKRGEKIVFSARELIERHIGDEEFNIESAAAFVYISPSYLRQIFRQITGESFTEYLIRRRMETAEKLLQNPEYKIQDVAERTGYSNQRYFASYFKKIYHCTPTEYRERFLR